MPKSPAAATAGGDNNATTIKTVGKPGGVCKIDWAGQKDGGLCTI